MAAGPALEARLSDLLLGPGFAGLEAWTWTLEASGPFSRTGAGIAEFGHNVTCADIDQNKIDKMLE